MDLVSIILLIVGVVVIVGIVFYFTSIYNRLKSLKNSTEATLGQVRVALKKRLDTIEQLLGSVKSYATFEKETFEGVTKMRTAVMSAGVSSLSEIDRESRRMLGGIVAVAENYPALRTSEPVAKLMDSIKSIEDEVARHRYTYNNIIQEFNTLVDTIPSKYVAASQHMSKMEYFKIEEEVEKRPEIKF